MIDPADEKEMPSARYRTSESVRYAASSRTLLDSDRVRARRLRPLILLKAGARVRFLVESAKFRLNVR